MARADFRSNRPVIEIADVLRRHGDAYRHAHAGHLGRVERRVMSAITACRTVTLGGHVEACDDCGMTRIAYNSCRNRHCPKCQGPARAAWLAAREAELLPVPYFHVVFTLPAPIAMIAFPNKAAVYAILFKAAAEAMMTLASNPRRLGAEIGVVAVLHTWGQALTHHPPCPLRRSRRRPLLRRRAVGGRPGDLLPARQAALPALQTPVSRTPEGCLQRRRPRLLRRSSASRRAHGIRHPSHRHAARRLGRLFQKAVRRTCPGSRLSRALHSPRRYCQQPPRRPRQRPCRL